MKMKKVIAILCTTAIMTLTGCGGTASDTATSGLTGDDVFQVILGSKFVGFHPLLTNDLTSTNVNAQIYETLYTIDMYTGEYVCQLAEDFPEFSEDGLSAVVKLREGVTFHDGTPFNAEAVEYTFDLIKDPDFGSARASLATSIDSMDILDEHTIQFNLSYEDGVLLAKFAHTNSAIVSPTAEQNQDLMIDPVGTGPYEFVSSLSGANVVLTRYEDYWGDLPEIKDCVMTVVEEESTAIARLETGEAHFLPDITVEQLERVSAMDNVSVAVTDSAQIVYVMLRADSSINPIMEEKDFRVALAKGIDGASYVDTVMDGYAEYAESIIGPKVFGYTEEATDSFIGYDPEGAKAILDANPGWADEEISFLVRGTTTYTRIAEYMQITLKQAGFNNINIVMMDDSAWLTESKANNAFDISVSAWSNVTRDGSELFEPNFHSETGALRARNGEMSTEIDGYIYDSKTTTDVEKRIANLLAVNEVLLEEALAVPFYHGVNTSCVNSAYEGAIEDSQGTLILSNITMAK